VDQPELLHRLQATGPIGRTTREEGRNREAGLPSEETGTLIVQSRFPAEVEGDSAQLEAQTFALTPAGEPAESAIGDVVALIKRAILYAANNQEFLLVELGGWDAPAVPFCLFALAQEENGSVSIVETNPIPQEQSSGRPPRSLRMAAAPCRAQPIQTRSQLRGSSSWNRSLIGESSHGTWL